MCTMGALRPACSLSVLIVFFRAFDPVQESQPTKVARVLPKLPFLSLDEDNPSS